MHQATHLLEANKSLLTILNVTMIDTEASSSYELSCVHAPLHDLDSTRTCFPRFEDSTRICSQFRSFSLTQENANNHEDVIRSSKLKHNGGSHIEHEYVDLIVL